MMKKFLLTCCTFFITNAHILRTKTQINKSTIITTQSISKHTQNAAKQIIMDFFTRTKNIRGKFIHIYSTAQTNHVFSGIMIMEFNPLQFKWHYIQPATRQIVKTKTEAFVQYKEEGKKAYFITVPMPITFLFHTPVEQWINNIEIINTFTDTNGDIHIIVKYKYNPAKKMPTKQYTEEIHFCFNQNPNFLKEWSFVDRNKTLHRIVLQDVSINVSHQEKFTLSI